ncbi:MAG TPA: HNH endonuclease signature motif containing protein, partial [Galbitalea sp.]
LQVDPTIIPGAGRAPVRVIVDAATLDAGTGVGLLEENLSPISFAKLEEYLCAGGTVEVLVGDSGDILNFGREQRLYTPKQRQALAVRDAGCRYPGCAKPASWCEAHHILQWKRDHGPTTLDNGILLCRYHHMLIHNNGWEIHLADGTYWLTKPTSLDPHQVPIEMPSNNPIITRIQHRNLARTG